MIVCQGLRTAIIRGFFLPDTSLNKVKLKFLSLLKDLNFTRRLNWGSAVLACLFRVMCRGSAADQLEIGDYLVLLQV